MLHTCCIREGCSYSIYETGIFSYVVTGANWKQFRITHKHCRTELLHFFGVFSLEEFLLVDRLFLSIYMFAPLRNTCMES